MKHAGTLHRWELCPLRLLLRSSRIAECRNNSTIPSVYKCDTRLIGVRHHSGVRSISELKEKTMAKQRSHNEWFRSVSLNNRKSCPSCKKKLEANEKIWSWGEYRFAKWNTVKHFCKACFAKEVREPLVGHTDDCGCKVELNIQGNKPYWLNLDAVCPLEQAVAA